MVTTEHQGNIQRHGSGIAEVPAGVINNVLDFSQPDPAREVEEKLDRVTGDVLRCLEGYGVPPKLAPHCAMSITRILTEHFASSQQTP